MILSDRLRFILIQPSHAGNIGSAARAMKVMGFTQLAVVQPRETDPGRHPEAIAFASRATDILDHLEVFTSLDEALALGELNIAVSAAGREFGPAALSPEQLGQALKDELGQALLGQPSAGRVNLLFGPERTGLSIDMVQRCQWLCAIPTFGDYGSLNLAQAVQVIAYELAKQAGALVMPTEPQAKPADHWAQDRALEGLYAHLERTAVALSFLDPKQPKRFMPRMRRLFGRSRLTVKEVDILRGLLSQMDKHLPQSKD